MNKEIAKFSRGSLNYGINIPSSDEDYLVFTVPTLEEAILKDIPKNKHQMEGNQDITISDIRQLKHMFKKANFDGVQFLWAHYGVCEEDFSSIFIDERTQMLHILNKQLHRLTMSTLGEYRKTTKRFYEKIHVVGEVNKFYVNMFIKLDAIIYMYSQENIDFLPYYITGQHKTKPVLRDNLSTDDLRNIRLSNTVSEEFIKLVRNKVDFINNTILKDGNIKPLSDEEFEELWSPIDSKIAQAIIKQGVKDYEN